MDLSFLDLILLVKRSFLYVLGKETRTVLSLIETCPEIAKFQFKAFEPDLV